MPGAIIPTSVAFSPADKKLLAALKDRTGISRTELLRRLLHAYAGGAALSGLPRINPPLQP